MRKIGLLLLTLFLIFSVAAQRVSEKLDRGVVVVNKGSSKLLVSWRYLATDPEDIAFNVYRAEGNGTPEKINPAPIKGATNYVYTYSGMGVSAATYSVRPVINGIEGEVGGSWDLDANKSAGSIVRNFNFYPFPEGYPKMSMKFTWVGDLDGDGRYDFVMDRHPGGLIEAEETDASPGSVYVDAYNSDGTFLWRINGGVNINLGSGQSGALTVFDMDGDSKAEVLMAVSEGTTFPDGTVIKNADGTVHDYSSVLGSPPHWLAILDGLTGNLIDTIGIAQYNHIKSDRSDSWKSISGHFIIQYLDGIHPSLVYQYKSRKAAGNFTGAYEAFRYVDRKLVSQWSTPFYRENTQYEAHQVRGADVDGDGKDEVVEISYAIDDDGSELYQVPGIAHGDRHCLADIDPDRPGLEQFFIQQTNILGMGIHDAATGEIIKANYLAAVADVGRGICAAFDTTRRGMQYYSTMSSNAMYDCKGNLTGTSGSFPAEALWWGPYLSRMEVDAAGNDKNPTMELYSQSSKSVGRYQNLYKADVSGAPSDYYIAAPNGGRAAFWGDMLGDWREELIYARRDTTGFVIMSTTDETKFRQYCLMQNPAYRAQTTTKGYYQTPDVDFYMANDMPLPPVAPVQKADVYLTNQTAITSDLAGNSVMLDIRNNSQNITLNENVELSRLWLMNPKGHNYIIGGTGKFTGKMDIVKSMQGDVILDGDHDFTGTTRISEGRLFVNGSLNGKVRLDARGVLGGDVILNGGIVLEEGLNVEGGRLEPGNGSNLGSMTINGNLELVGRNTLAFDLDQEQNSKIDQLHIQGDFIVSGVKNNFLFKAYTDVLSDTISFITYTGSTNITADQINILGLEGIPYSLIIGSHSIQLIVKSPRVAGEVEWSGLTTNVWDFESLNFKYNNWNEIFVPGDAVTFNDKATRKSIIINETMPVSLLKFENNSAYSISGMGVISGAGGLVKTGSGKLSLLNEENSFTGGVDFSDGVLEVKSLKNGGATSSIGASSAASTNWIMRNATLQSASQMATDRNMTIVGKLTVNNPASNNSIMIGGNITGSKTKLELIGLGTLNLQGVNVFDTVTIKNGTLALGSVASNSTGLGSSVVVLEGGTLQMRDANSTSTTGPWTNTVIVPEGKSARWNTPMRWRFSNKLYGSGTLSVYVTYVRADFDGDWSQFQGTLNVIADSDGGDFRVNNNYGYGKANVVLNNNVNFYALTAGRTIKLGSLSGTTTAKMSGDNTYWVVGGNNTKSTTYAGLISGTAAKLTKEGTGLLKLTGANTYTGSTDVVGGTLQVANATASATGTGGVAVRGGATLTGNGLISGSVSVYTSGNLDLLNNTIETLSIGGFLSIPANTTLKIDINAGQLKSDLIQVGGNMAIGANLEITKLGSTAFQDGQEFKIFNVTGTTVGEFADILPHLDNNLVWDQSKLISDGIIMVKTATALNEVNAGKEVKSVEYYNVSGYQVSEWTPGIVIRKINFTNGSAVVEKIYNRQ